MGPGGRDLELMKTKTNEEKFGARKVDPLNYVE